MSKKKLSIKLFILKKISKITKGDADPIQTLCFCFFLTTTQRRSKLSKLASSKLYKKWHTLTHSVIFVNKPWNTGHHRIKDFPDNHIYSLKWAPLSPSFLLCTHTLSLSLSVLCWLLKNQVLSLTLLLCPSQTLRPKPLRSETHEPQLTLSSKETIFGTWVSIFSAQALNFFTLCSQNVALWCATLWNLILIAVLVSGLCLSWSRTEKWRSGCFGKALVVLDCVNVGFVINW